MGNAPSQREDPGPSPLGRTPTLAHDPQTDTTQQGPVTMTPTDNTQAHLAMTLKGITRRLEDEFGELFTRETLDHYVKDSYEQLAATAKVHTLIPAFVQRFARQRLAALAKTQAQPTHQQPEVLFVCERNDAISQMAASLLNTSYGDRAHADSAGANPSAALLEEAIVVMQEVGVDMSDEFPKPISPEVEQLVDVIVTLDAHDDIPILDGKRYQAWQLPAVDHQAMEGYRVMRDEIRERVHHLITEIV